MDKEDRVLGRVTAKVYLEYLRQGANRCVCVCVCVCARVSVSVNVFACGAYESL
jgi:hypothetical protein